MSFVNIGWWQVALVIGGLGVVTWFIVWIVGRIERGGAAKQKADQDQAELQERIDADAKMQKAAEEYAKKGGHRGALERRDY